MTAPLGDRRGTPNPAALRDGSGARCSPWPAHASPEHPWGDAGRDRAAAASAAPQVGSWWLGVQGGQPLGRTKRGVQAESSGVGKAPAPHPSRWLWLPGGVKRFVV